MENLTIFVIVIVVMATVVLLYNRTKKRDKVVGKGDYEYIPTEDNKTDENLNEPIGRE